MLRNSLYNIISSVLNLLLNFWLLSYTSRLLGAEGRGEYTLVLFYSSLLQIISAIIGSSMMVYMLRKIGEEMVLFFSFIWSVITVALGTLVFIYFSILIDKIFVFFLISIVQSLYANMLSYYSYGILYKRILTIRVLQPILYVLLLLVFEINNTTGVLYVYSFSFLIPLFPFFIETIKKSCQISKKKGLFPAFKEYLKFGTLNQINNLFQFGAYRYVIWLLSSWSSLKSLGVFGVWLSLIDAMWVIPTSIASVNHTYVVNKKQSLSILKVSSATFILLLLTFGVLYVIPDEIYIQVLGLDFVLLKNMLSVSAVGVSFFCFNKIYASYFSAKGLIRYNTVSSGIGFIVVLALSFPLVKNYGLIGAVIANSISYFLTTCVTLFIYKYIYKPKQLI